jgi:hypothetical protein
MSCSPPERLIFAGWTHMCLCVQRIPLQLSTGGGVLSAFMDLLCDIARVTLLLDDVPRRQVAMVSSSPTEQATQRSTSFIDNSCMIWNGSATAPILTPSCPLATCTACRALQLMHVCHHAAACSPGDNRGTAAGSGLQPVPCTDLPIYQAPAMVAYLQRLLDPLTSRVHQARRPTLAAVRLAISLSLS